MGKKHGTGSYLWADGSQYSGEMNNNQIKGKGTYIWKDGHKYEGEWDCN